MAVNYAIYRSSSNENTEDTRGHDTTAHPTTTTATPPPCTSSTLLTRPAAVLLSEVSRTVQRYVDPPKHRQSVYRVDMDGLYGAQFRLEVRGVEGACSGIAYIDRAGAEEGCEEVSVRDCRWQVPFSEDVPLEAGWCGASGVWQVVVYLFADAEAMDVQEEHGAQVPQYKDLTQPWQLCRQTQSGIELEEVLLKWFDTRVERSRQYVISLAPFTTFIWKKKKNAFYYHNRSITAELLDINQQTPLHHSCMGVLKGAVPLVKILLRRMPRGSVCARDKHRRTALHYAACTDTTTTRKQGGHNAALVALLLDDGAIPIDATDCNGDTALHMAARSDTEPCKTVTALLERGALITVNATGETPLSTARLYGALHTAAVLELWKSTWRQKQAVPVEGVDIAVASQGISEAQLEAAFSAFDKKNTGFIAYSDYQHIEQRFINEYGIGVGSNLIQSTMSKYDLLVDGLLSFDAFAMLMNKIPQI